MSAINKSIHFALFMLFLSVFTNSSFAQSVLITGSVSTVSDHTPIPGANVIIKGTTVGVITDVNGKFQLNVPPKTTLVISFIGYQSKEIQTGNKTQIDVFLEEGQVELDEVVAIGYGYVRKSDLTGAVSSVSNKDIEGRGATSFDDLLRSRVAGVRVVSSDGAPGGGVSIKVRGGTSINASSEPLYVIDGFPVLSDGGEYSVSPVGAEGSKTNPLADLNPEDIESIEILKDASSTAIYGSRGANGVILITTKKPTGGKSQISYSGYYGVQLKPKQIPLLDSREYSILENERLNRYPSKGYSGNQIYDAEKWGGYTQGLADLNQKDWSQETNTNWQDQIYELGQTNKHQLSMSGGNDKTKYLWGIDYFKNKGVVKNTDFTRFSGKISVEHKVKKWLDFSTITNISYSEQNGITQSSGASIAAGIFIKTMRYSPLYSPDSGIMGEDDGTDDPVSNPLHLLNDITKSKLSRQIMSNNSLTFKILPGLTLKTSAGIKINAIKQKIYYPSTTGLGSSVNGKARIGSVDIYDLLNENILTYNKKVGKHSFNVMGGLTFQVNKREYYEANAQDFAYEGLGTGNIGMGSTLIAPYSNEGRWAMMSGLARLNYSYANKYLLTASLRADGSSRFARDNRWGYFPSVALAWRANEEQFLKDISFLSNLKVRTSYGVTGNQEIGLYKSKRTYNSNSLAFGDVLNKGFSLGNVGNDDLTWEKTFQYDAGLDAGFFSNRLTFTVDYYYKITKDLLLDVPTLPSSGFSSMMQNIGKIRNQGIELSVNADIISNQNNRKKLGWSMDFNISKNENTVLSLGSTNEFFRSLTYKNTASDQVIVRTGEPLGSWYGYVTNGIFQYNDPDLNKFTSVQGNTPTAGDWKYADMDNNNIIDENDRVILGCSQPKFFGGFSTTFSYRNFELKGIFEYSYGAKLFNANRIEGEDMTGSNNRMKTVLDRWVGPDWQTDASGQVILENGNAVAVPGTGNPSNTMPRAGYISTYQLQDNFIEDGSYLRISNIKLSYNFTKKLCRKIGINNASVYASAQNPFLFTSYTGPDPEVNMDPHGYGNIIAGYDYDAYPRSRTFILGLNFSF